MKTCRTCAHHRLDEGTDICTFPIAEDRRIGREKGFQWCSNARTSMPWGECGEEGRLWEPKKPVPPPSSIRLESCGWDLFDWIKRLCR